MKLRSLAPLGVAVIWGVNIPIMKGAIGHLHPFAFNTIRLTLSVLVLGLMEWRSRGGPVRFHVPAGSQGLVRAMVE